MVLPGVLCSVVAALWAGAYQEMSVQVGVSCLGSAYICGRRLVCENVSSR
jgi:hypothetical protein